MSDTVTPALQRILTLLQREVTTEEYDKIRAQWFAHVDNEEKLFVPHSPDEGARALDAVMATLTDDCEFRLPTGESWKGQAAVRQFYEQQLLTAFENMVWAPQAVVIGPQGVLDIAEMSAVQRKKFGPLDRVDTAVRVLWAIHWPWDPQAEKFTAEIVYALQYLA